MKGDLAMKKGILMLVMCLSIALAVTGCIGAQYSKEDKESAAELGRKMMQEWLDKNLKGGKVSDKGLSALAEGKTGGNYYLSDLVEGLYSYNGEKYTFIINTTTGAVYSSKNYQAFKESAWKLFLKELGLNEDEIIPENTVNGNDGKDYFSIYYCIEASLREGKYNKEAARDTYFHREVLPIDVEDAEDFATDLKNRNLIEMEGSIHLKENADLRALSLNVLMEQKEKTGIDIPRLHIYDDDEDIADYGTSLTYKKHGYLDMGDYQLFAVIEQFNDNSKNGKIDHTEAKLDVATYQPITAIDSGYEIKPGSSDEIYQGFNIIAGEDSEIKKHDYDLEKENSQGTYGKQYECSWKDRGDGTFVLVDSAGYIINFGHDCRITIRE